MNFKKTPDAASAARADALAGPGRRQAGAALMCSALGLALWPARGAWAQDTVDMAKVLLGVPAGSMIDHVARRMAEALKGGYAANTFVENKTGANGILAVSAGKQAAPDGRTVLVATSSSITVYPSTYRQLPYNPLTDLQPVSTLVTFDIALAVGPMVPKEVVSLQDFFAWCKAHPNQASFGSPASGSIPHFLGSMAARSAGAPLQHVPYRGPSGAVIDMVGGQLASVVVPLVDVAEFAANGRCRILAVTGDKRSRFMPQVPTFEEQGLGEYAIPGWIGVFLPAGTPAPLLRRLSETLKAAFADPRFIAAMAQQAQEVRWTTPDELRQRMEAEQAKWAAAVKALNFTPET